MIKVFDLEGTLPEEEGSVTSGSIRQLGSDSPNRLDARPGYGLGNYSRIFPRRGESAGQAGSSLGGSRTSLDSVVAELTAAGVVRSLVGSSTRVPNSTLAAAVRSHPDHFLALAYLSPFDGMRASRELERLIRDEHLSGLMVSALAEVLPASDRRYYPLYAKCVELGVPVRIYTSLNYANDRPYDLGHPRHLDQVAIDFPELTIIAGLSGWPWVNDMVALLRRHPNLYADTAAHRPKYFATHGSGWEQFLHFGNSVLQDKIMVGLSRGLMPLPVSTLIEEYLALPLKDSVMEKWLYSNAARVFNLQ